MSLKVSLMYVNCNESPVSINIIGSGMDSAGINIVNPNGVYPTFLIIGDNPNNIKLSYFNPAFIDGAWSIGFNFQPGIYTTTLRCPAVDLSGIYFINPAKKTISDSYYTVEYKIPDPVIHTALIGE